MKEKIRRESKCNQSGDDEDESQSKRPKRKEKQKLTRSDKHTRGFRRRDDVLSEESNSDLCTDTEIKRSVKGASKKVVKQQSKTISSIDTSSE